MAVLLFTFWQEDTDRGVFRSPDFKRLKADLILYDIKYRRDARGKGSQWVVQADVAKFFEKKRKCEFDNVKITFLPTGSQPVNVIARKGLYDLDQGDLRVSGDVVVRGFRDYVLYSDQLLYDPQDMTIRSPGTAEMVGAGGNRLLGHSMIYYIKDSRLILLSPRAVISEQGSEID